MGQQAPGLRSLMYRYQPQVCIPKKELPSIVLRVPCIQKKNLLMESSASRLVEYPGRAGAADRESEIERERERERWQ